MADISAIKLPNNTTLNLKDASALKQLEFADHSLVALTRAGTSTTIDLGEFDTLSVTDLNAGNLVTTGVGRFTNGLYGNLTGNADTATKFASAQSVTLTGDVTGTASSQAGWSITTSLAASGVTANSYGPSANVSPSHGGTFSVPYITVDSKGRVTSASTKTITLPGSGNTDTKVTQNAVAASSYTNWRPLIFGASNSSTEGFSPSTTTDQVYATSTLSVQPSSGTIRATTFKGNATSATTATNATNATNATKATQDESGNNIKASYAASFSISDHTITLKNKNGASLGTVTVPDNNTTYTIATGDSNGQIKVTPSSGDAYNVSVKGLGSAAYTASTAYATSAQGTLATNAMPKSGGTFTGAVTLSGDPTANLHAATKQYVDTQLTNGIAASDAMVFKGTVGTGGTATSLPTSSVVVGDTYKAISAISIAAGSSWTGSAVSAKSGDLIVAMANTPKWIVVPSGDETVTTVKYSTTTQNLTTSAQSGAITVGEAATKQVVTSIDATANLPTANAVKTFVENKGYVTSSGVTSVATGVGLTGGTITGTGTIKAKLKSETNATYDSASVTNTSSRQYAVVPDKSGYLSVNVPWTAYSNGTGISIANGVINHSNSVTAGTAGTSSATSGPTIAIPYVTYDAQGHVTAVGTHTHTVNGALSVTSLSASSYVTVNSDNSGTAGGLALYSTTPTTYGITMRQTSNQGKHGYVQGDWAIYNHMSGATNRGFVWKLDSNSIASISGSGSAVFNGSVTVGGNAGNTSGCRMEFDSTLKCVNWIFN